MPVRNFWIAADVDGRSTMLEGGPRSRDGGFSLTIYIRDNGGILRAVSVDGIARSDGTLALDVSPASEIRHSDTGRVVSDEAGGFTVTTQSGRPGPSMPTALTRELLTPPDPENGIGVLRGTAAVAAHAVSRAPDEPICRYLLNEVPTREDCDCVTCTMVLTAERARAEAIERDNAASPLGTDPFGRPYTSA